MVRIGRYNDVKFDKPRLNSVRGKANDKVFCKSGSMSIISLECVRKFGFFSKLYIHDLLDVFSGPTKFHLNRMRTSNFT